MLALQEFGITEYSSNYTLCEVKVDVSIKINSHAVTAAFIFTVQVLF